MLTSAVIYKQRLLHEKDIVQLLLNYKYYSVDQSRFRKLLQSSVKNLKDNFPPKKLVHFYRLLNL